MYALKMRCYASHPNHNPPSRLHSIFSLCSAIDWVPDTTKAGSICRSLSDGSYICPMSLLLEGDLALFGRRSEKSSVNDETTNRRH